ncbi:MAG: hypothetical protein CMF55_06580 [Legionellales bacterium]|nr:hypothetical protein [Legionellales bacterium]
MRSVSEPNFADIATFSRNQVRNAIKKLLRALCINLNACGDVPESLHPAIFNEATFAKFPLSKAKEILHQEIINLFKNKVALLKDLLSYRALHRFYGLLPRVLRKDFVEFPLFDPLTLFQDKTPFADDSPYSMMFAVQHFLFQADCINRSNYSDAMHGPLHFLNAYVDVIWRMGMSELWNDCVMLYRSLDKRSEFVNDYAVCRGQLFALKPIMHPCEVSQVSSYESYNTSDGDTSTLSTLS